jgi:murein DD-endopeptidase MepM/ murein hydrolase activator NlpD
VSLIPTPAVLGATALVIAGGGAVVVSSNSGGSDNSYENAATQADENVRATYARGGIPQVSRSVDREVLEAQAQAQAQQLVQIQAELAKKVQKHADELEANQWVLPLVGYTLSASWGELSYLWSTYHTGQDFSAATGTEIVSVAHGTVTYTGYDDSYGYKVEVTLDDGTVIWYCHQTEYVVSEGDELNPGDLIGYVGSTGNTTGPHLHLEVRIPDGSEDGQDVDPVPVFAEHGVTF